MDPRGLRVKFTGGYLGHRAWLDFQSLLEDGNVRVFACPAPITDCLSRVEPSNYRAGFVKKLWRAMFRSSKSRRRTKAPVVDPRLLDRASHIERRRIVGDPHFEGSPQSMLILGERTAGLTDSGTYWDLSDGAVLSIMSQRVYDRHGTRSSGRHRARKHGFRIRRESQKFSDDRCRTQCGGMAIHSMPLR